ELVGKGLPTLVIAEFFGLSIPLTVALTLPMAVLVATLYAFSRLAAENEITALKASGVSLVSVLRPVLWAALGVTIVMIGFNDQILPRSNHRLATLQRDIAQKKPTFGLREQVINEVSPGKFYLRAGHLDEATNLMREVTIYDMSDPTRRRTIFADSGNMGMSRNLTDLELTLYNGNMQDVPTNNPDELQRLYFNVDLVRFRGVGNQFQKTTTDSYKSDREMTVCEMQAAQDKARKEHDQARRNFQETVTSLQKAKATLSKEVRNVDPSPPWDIGLGRLYCGVIALLSPKAAHAQTVQSMGSHTAPRLQPPPKTQVVPPRPSAIQRPVTIQPPPPSPQTASELAQVEALRIRLEDSSQLMNAYGVEIHKKFALAVACFVFVLLGAPIALRFPRGGVGLTIGVSLFVFALYYVCLIAGESLGKRGLMPAVLSMWMANVIFALIALLMLAKMGKEGSTARGGDMREMFDSIRGWVRSKVGRKPIVQPERAAA
ncbi:MAG: LptF/LptG family permease, partial [Gemmatimonadota bacterium]|nr:LptF/LptG family permease [Gemmatimonadota bacterium]